MTEPPMHSSDDIVLLHYKLAEDGSGDPLRAQDLIDFFVATNRSPKCPCCPHEGAWDFSLQTVEGEGEGEGSKNLPLSIYVHVMIDGQRHTTAGMTCPKCGHFAQISTYKIREFQASRGK
ncbi:hypothetical protein [Pseudomonas sp. MWU12-2345]|uniref:hypothetical protein n=1 Tax=Pseudomonas sp. MWU12-2345 TaxID=2928689 RepID=UPI00200D440A|nr:hypothetical protein [Pseudomonas sp. MWU12-2345]